MYVSSCSIQLNPTMLKKVLASLLDNPITYPPIIFISPTYVNEQIAKILFRNAVQLGKDLNLFNEIGLNHHFELDPHRVKGLKSAG